MRTFLFAIGALGLLSAMTTLGCKKEAATTPAEPAATDAAATDAASTESPATDAAATEETDAFATLTEADRTAAMAQKVCPVSDEPLGSMGTPLKVTVEGRDVFLCCEGCKDAIEAEPAKYLAKLDAPATGDEAATQ